MKTEAPIRFGEQTTTKVEPSGVITEDIERYVDYQVVKGFRRQSITVRVKNDKDILAEFLKLLDRQKSGEIHSTSFECIPNRSELQHIERVKMSWICLDA